MRTAIEIYGKPFSEIANYQPMLEEFGKILIQVDVKDYQGDSFVLYQNGQRFGYLCFGWGSCSGCDALQACESFEEVQELMDKLYNSIRWFDSIKELKQFFDKDMKGEYEYHLEEFHEFVYKVKLFVSQRIRLTLMRDFEQLAREDTVNKACLWLKENAKRFSYDGIDEEKLVEEFKKAMAV